MTEPVVSVVLIVYDDRERVGRALRSALQQPGPALEVVAVDDGSTDGTAEVLAQWASEDPRVRVVTRAGNSGGCGAPRNDGLDAARGRYVMFLDSDDELEPGAVAALVQHAESSGADVVLGRATRWNEDVGTAVPWRPGVFERLGVTTTAAEPGLVRDTLVVDKLYRRELLDTAGLRFPTDIHYEDLVFTAAVYARCSTVEITDVPVYTWYVRAAEGDLSITNQRHDLRNLADRVEASRRADAVLAEAGRDDLRVVKDRKLVDQDLALYLRDLPDRDPSYGTGLLDVLQPYLATLQEPVRRSPAQPGALVQHLIAQRDLAGLTAAAALAYRGRVVRPVRRASGAWRWDGVDGAAGDVTSLVAPLVRGGLHVDHQVTRVWVEAGRVHVAVTTTDPLGTVGASGRLRVQVLSRARRRTASLRLAQGRVAGTAGGAVTWEARLALDPALRAAAVPGEIQLRVLARVGRRFSLAPLFVDPALVRDESFEVGDRGVRPFRHAGGHLGLTRTR